MAGRLDGVARIQTGQMLDFGDVKVVGMSIDEFRKAVGLRVGPTVNGVAQIFLLPQDIIDNTVKAFNVSPTSASGYSALGVPTGRYLAPANGPDCIETAPGYGDLRSAQIGRQRTAARAVRSEPDQAHSGEGHRQLRVPPPSSSTRSTRRILIPRTRRRVEYPWDSRPTTRRPEGRSRPARHTATRPPEPARTAFRLTQLLGDQHLPPSRSWCFG